ncbi:aminoacyl-tRNA deacylase [Patescibacteria group bacterium]
MDKIRELLEKNSMWYDYFEHEPVRTSEEAAKVRPNYSLQQGAKALVLKTKHGLAMIVVPGDKKFDKKKAMKILGSKKISLATPEEVEEVTDGVKIGGVPPFGNLFGLKVYMDKSILDLGKIIFNAGDRRISIGMKPQDYKTLVNPKVVDLT